MASVTKLPEPGVILDLDALERPEGEVKAPFVVKVSDRKITFKDPAEIDWQDLATVDIPADIFRVSLSKEDRKFFLENPMETWRFHKLLESYYSHYDFEEKIRAAKRQASLGG